MTDFYDNATRNDLIKYRCRRSKDAMKEAELLFENGYYNGAISKLYYAAYYAASSLILKYQLKASTHSGIKTMLGLHFVSKKLLSFQAGKTFSTLFEKRQSSDYDDFTFCDNSTYLELKPLTEQFIEEVENLLNQK